jgi:nitrate/nitrite transporter NarK
VGLDARSANGIFSGSGVMTVNVWRIFLPVYPRVVLFVIFVIVVLIFMLVRLFLILISIFFMSFIQTVLEPRRTVEVGDVVGTSTIGSQPAVSRRSPSEDRTSAPTR